MCRPILSALRSPAHAALLWALLTVLAPALPARAAEPTPPPTSALSEPARQADTVQRAYDLLLDRFVHPLSPAALVGAAWEQLEREAAEQQAPAPGPAPAVSDDRAADSVALRTALVAYLARPAAAWPPAFVPAYAAIRGMARLAAEHHTYFLDPARYRDEQAWASGVDTFGGIGIQLQGPRSTIIDVDEGTPAARAGLVPGDELVRVDGVDVAGLTPLRVAELVRGPLGSSVELVVRHQADALATLQLQRERIQLPAVALQELGDVGYIRLRGFAEPSVVGALEQGVSTLQDQGARGLVIDLRDNPGGRLDVGARLLGDFLPAGTALYQQVDRSGAQQMYVAETGSGAAPLPLVLLVGSQTQSMAELFAAALQAHGAATLVGTPTRGNVAAGVLFPLGDGSALDVTISEILSAEGAPLNDVGVTPDVLVEGTRATTPHGEDPVLGRALALLHGDEAVE